MPPTPASDTFHRFRVPDLPPAGRERALWTPCAPARPRVRRPGPMSAATWITMITIVGFVWGGFLLAVVTAFRRETDKAE